MRTWWPTPMSNYTTMRTVSDNSMDLLNPSADAVSAIDIAYSLARIKRFNGHTTISVAQHSFEVMLALYARPDFPAMLMKNGMHMTAQSALLYALLHDAHEAYTGDISRPMNNAIAQLADGLESPVNPIKRDVQVAIHRHFELPAGIHPRLREAISIADRKLLNIDRWLFKIRWESTSEEQSQGLFLRTLEALLLPNGAAFVGQFDEWPGNESEQSPSLPNLPATFGQQERTPAEKAKGPGQTAKGIDLNVGGELPEKGCDA